MYGRISKFSPSGARGLIPLSHWAFAKGRCELIRMKGVQQIAAATGLTTVALYEAVGDNGDPTLSTPLALTKALGVKLSIAS